MKRHEMWRREYLARQYMQHLSEGELKQRAKDIFNNLITITNEAKIGLPPMDSGGTKKFELWTHLLQEFENRFGPYPGGFSDGFIKDAPVPTQLGTRAKCAGLLVSDKDVKRGTYLVKYGQLQYMKPAFSFGTIRISPASAYSDLSLAPGIQDYELSRSISPPPSEIKIRPVGDPSAIGFSPLSFELSEESKSDYYVFCLSEFLSPRLFQDFDQADSCLLIRNPSTFLARLRTSVASEIGDFLVAEGPVRYYDPLNTSWGELDVYRSKHFRYEYQQEFRVVWVPREPRQDLDYLNIELGPLDDCCELIEL